MKTSATDRPPIDRHKDAALRERIMSAAFSAFVEKGYAGTSTLEIATRAKVSKRDLYLQFGTKEGILIACIQSRADRIRLESVPYAPRTREELARSLTGLAERTLAELTDPTVVAMFRLAIAEANRSPELAAALESSGRQAVRQTVRTLIELGQSSGLIEEEHARERVEQFLALVWEDLRTGLLLGTVARPSPDEMRRRAAEGTEAFLKVNAR